MLSPVLSTGRMLWISLIMVSVVTLGYVGVGWGGMVFDSLLETVENLFTLAGKYLTCMAPLGLVRGK